jgi:molecular chaperone GrpE
MQRGSDVGKKSDKHKNEPFDKQGDGNAEAGQGDSNENQKKSENGTDMKTDLEAAEQLYKELLDRYQRSLAEFDNYRKRTIKEKSAAYDDGLRDAVEKLLPIIDNFERALAAVENTDDKFYQGVNMIARQLGSYLSDMGVVPITSVNEPFNVNLHHAVAHVEDDQYGSSVVIEELQKGYMHKDKVIRTSMVKVAN